MILPSSLGVPSAPTFEEIHQEPSSPIFEERVRPRQVEYTPSEKLDYMPSSGKKPLYLNLKKSDFYLNSDCELKISDINDTTLTLCCLRDHKCEEQKKSLKVLFRELGNKPKQPAIFFHLKMLHLDPSHLNTIRQFLGIKNISGLCNPLIKIFRSIENQLFGEIFSQKGYNCCRWKNIRPPYKTPD